MKKLIALLLAVACLLGCVAFAGDDVDKSKTVKKAEVGQLPVKTAYVVGEEFTLEGGTIIVTYDDGTTDEIPMTAPSLTVKEPGMKAPGTKTVTIKAGKKSARFTVDVANNSFLVTYDHNYEGAPAAEAVETVKGQLAENKTPARDGYTFAGWYVDPDFTRPFDFKTEIVADTALFALWTRDGAEHADVTFDYAYYGPKLTRYSYPVEVGTPVARPVADPVRVGYTFDKWVDESGAAYDFAAPVNAAITISATWKKTAGDVNTWLFEAEDTNLTGKTGPAVSGTANEIGMILKIEDRGISNDRAVGYLYKFGNSLEFYIAADEDLTDVKLTVSLTAELEDLTLNPGYYSVYLNGVSLNYATIVIDEVPPMDPVLYVADVPQAEEFVIAEGLTLKKGANVIKLVTENEESYTGSTMLAHAPIVDCIKLETSGVITWDENYGVPAVDNY